MFHANRAPILHQDWNYLQTDRTKVPHEPLHQGKPSRAFKLVSQPMVHLAQTVYLSCTETNTISKETEVRFYMTHIILEFYWVLPNIFLSIWYVRCNSSRSSIGCVENGFLGYDALGAICAPILHQDQHYLQTKQTELPLEPLYPGVSSGASKMVSQAMMHQAQTVYLSCTKTNSVSKQTEARFHMTHVIQELYCDASKQISQHMVCSMQTMHLSCIKISTISKQIEPTFHLSLFTQDYHQVLP